MPVPATDSTIELPFVKAVEAARSLSHSHLEEEVAELFTQLRSSLLRYLLTFRLPSQTGEEILQDAFLALFKHLRRGGNRANLRGWVFRVAHNLALKKRMANQREWTESGGADAEQYSDPALNPEQQMAFTQKQRRLRAVLRALPEADQRCLSLRAEGLRYREIAEILGISVGTVSITLSRSLARFEQANKG